MNIQQIDPKQACEILKNEPGIVYIDVRTEDEFENGHVPKAINIPVVVPNMQLGRMVPNPRFVSVVELHVPKDTRVIVGCQAGLRSQYAAELLTGSGYQRVCNMQGGIRWREGSDGSNRCAGMA